MSSTYPTDKEILDLETTIQEKMNTNRRQRATLNHALDAVVSIKMGHREIITSPEVKTIPAKPAVMSEEDSTVELKGAIPEIPGKPAITKTVFDVMPTDPKIPNAEIDHARRKQIYDAWNKVINPV